ncbi:hypothetical protein BT93_K1161 [Corymbia citriodora subsp. variegata]|nr:hypothetical protein BT93_K1161 [Corymbia citriodora subsp. variegata]
MMEEDTNRLDELAPPSTFCDRFKTCLARILECVCNRDFPSIKAEIL